ncbi:nucleoside hydrolase [uncultured Sphaerochaeta sp.]|uniref:nucleoside hydrolase n=1 Tax=uncultured Sphaerochaeta sp. TaxID=886478 RepID=UPI002A0A51FC|nr:nucleoside hydrolase [uncultured Sphaerochaeta sp.]
MSKRNIIVDTDPGHDDAIAIMLLLAHQEQFNILGFVTVAGNQTSDKVTTNMLKISELTRCAAPVVRGSLKPLTRELETGAEAHGISGMDGPDLPFPTRLPLDMDSIEFLYSTIMEAREKVTIVALGPLTNIAKLLLAHPEIKGNIEEISLMGGGINKGNKTATAEFNIYVDPEAAEIVYSSGIPIIMSGLDVTEKANIYPSDWEDLHTKGIASRFTASLLDFYAKYAKEHGFEGSSLHDPCATAYLIDPTLFEGTFYSVHIETKGELTRGMTVADKRSFAQAPLNVKVLTDIDRQRFIQLVRDSILTLDSQLK